MGREHGQFLLRKITVLETYIKVYKYSVLEMFKFLVIREKPTSV
jgi:hypothetical protein